MPYNFGDEDPLDGYDAAEDQSGAQQEPQAEPEAPVPGYTPAPGDVIPGTMPETAVEEDYGAVMAQVDRRMKVANYFRLILDNELFPGGEAEAVIAQTRIRRFVRDELEVLLGMKSAVTTARSTAVAQFTDEEVAALRELISRITKKPTPFKPVQQQQVTPPAPQFKPVTAAAVVPKPKPVAPPVQRTPAPAPRQQQAAPQGVDPRIPPQHRADPTAKIVNGKVYIQARTEDGEMLWVHEKKTGKKTPMMKDVTPVARPVGVQPLPMPSIAQINTIETARADESVQMIENMARRDPGMAKIAGGLLHSLQQSEE